MEFTVLRLTPCTDHDGALYFSAVLTSTLGNAQETQRTATELRRRVDSGQALLTELVCPHSVFGRTLAGPVCLTSSKANKTHSMRVTFTLHPTHPLAELPRAAELLEGHAFWNASQRITLRTVEL